MSSREHPLFTIKNDCQDCYKCVRECPVKAIKIEDNSAQIVPELCVNCADLYERAATEHAFSELGKPGRGSLPAAVLCHNDTVAIMLLRRLRECGLRVPEEIALVGQDNIFLAAQQTPSLTTIGYGTPAAVAEKLVDRVLKRIESPGLKRSVEKIPPELFLRESCPMVVR